MSQTHHTIPTDGRYDLPEVATIQLRTGPNQVYQVGGVKNVIAVLANDGTTLQIIADWETPDQ